MWDAFLSHASEDKSFVAALAGKLSEAGVKVWFDKFEIKIGDSITEKINEGLAESRAGIVVLSPAFFNKKWTKAELNALFSSNVESERLLLPVWHEIDREAIQKHAPLLADRRAALSKNGVEAIARELADVLRPAPLASKAVGKPDDTAPITLASLHAFLGEQAHLGDVYRYLRILHVNLIGQYREALENPAAHEQLAEVYNRLLKRDPDAVGQHYYLPFLFLEGKRGYALVEQSVLNSQEYLTLIGEA